METEKIPEIIRQTIEVLSEKFGAKGAQLWDVLLRQAYLDGIKSVFSFFASFGVGIYSLQLLRTGFRLAKIGNDDPTGYFLAGTIILILALIFFIASICEMIDNFGNPEFQAVSFLIKKEE